MITCFITACGMSMSKWQENVSKLFFVSRYLEWDLVDWAWCNWNYIPIIFTVSDGTVWSRRVIFSLFAWLGEVSPKTGQLTSAQGNSDTNDFPFQITKNITHSDGCIQGSYRSWKTRKVMECKNFISRPGKLWNLIVDPWKSWKIAVQFDRLFAADDKARAM